jgi:tRNA A-37 threonylcarbamoyl transferase component Bud32
MIARRLVRNGLILLGRPIFGVEAWLARRRALATAARAWSKTLGHRVWLEVRESFFGSTLVCAVVGGMPDDPESVIVKRPNRRGEKRFDPANAHPDGMAVRLFNDWAGLEFLTEAAGSGTVCGRLLAADREAGLLVLERVGERGFDELLLGDDPVAAREAALEYGRALGRLHAASYGRQARYREIRSRLGPEPAPAEEVWGTRDWFARAAPELLEHCRRLGVAPGSDFAAELEDLAAAISDPGPWAAYVHGDAGADNLRLGNGPSRLIDFEHGGIRHALTDAAFPRMRFPTSFRVASFPEEVTLEVEECYRREVAESFPEARDAAVFRRRLLDGCAFWTFLTLTFALRPATGPNDRGSALDGDPSWGLSTLRQIVLGRLQAFLDFAQELDAFPAWRESLGHLSTVLDRRWGGVARLPLFPAFRRGLEEAHA